MARSSRHKFHRSHKHRDRSDSDSEADYRERKSRVEEEEPRVSEAERRRSSSGKDPVGSSNGEVSGEHGKKRKERGEDAADRWNGGGAIKDARVDKEPRKEGLDVVDSEKSLKQKASGADSKGKSSSRRREGSSERNYEKRNSEKESNRRESSSSQYKDGKEKEREREKERDRVPEKDRKVQASRSERSDDGGSRKDEQVVKKDVVSSELQEVIRNPELEKELEKRLKRRRDGSGDNDNLPGDGKESDARHTSSKDLSKNGSYKDGRSREKHWDDLDRGQRQQDDRRRDEHTSKIHMSDHSDVKHSKDDGRLSESRHRTKPQDSDHDGSPHVDDCRPKLKDNRARKRSADELENFSDAKPRSTKESREDTEKNGSRSSKLDSHADRATMERPHQDKVDSGPSNSRPKSSPGSSAYAVKEQNRNNSRKAESSCGEPLLEETRRSRTSSRVDHPTVSGGCERESESRSLEKTKLKDDIHSDVHAAEATASSHYDKTLRSDVRTSPKQLRGKSPSTSDRRSERIGARRILDVEEVAQRSNIYKDGRDSSFTKDIGRDRELPIDKLKVSGSSQLDLIHSESTSHGSSFYNRTSNLQGSSPGHLPPPPVRLGVDSPSVLGSYEDENRIQNGDRKANFRYRRSSDGNVGRGQGTPWKGTPTRSPAANSLMPIQHGPPAGFHPAVQRFPAPPFFGVRSSMDLNHTGISYHPNEANWFSGHARPYGWHNPVDDCPPHLQVWDGSNATFDDETHIYGRPDWNQNRHLMGSRRWEMNVDMWNGQNGNVNMEFSVPQKEQEYPMPGLADETWAAKSGYRAREEWARSDLPTADASEINRPTDTSPSKNAVGTAVKFLYEKAPDPSKMATIPETAEDRSDNYVRFCHKYLSKLDISCDLVPPELYKDSMSFMGKGDGIVASNISIQGHQKNNESQNAHMVANRKCPILNSLKSRSPTATDAIFQRAVSLYKKQTERMKEAMREEEKFSSASDRARNVDANSPNNMGEDLPMAGAEDHMEVEEKTTVDAETDVPEVEEERLDHPIYTDKLQCDEISESVVLAEEGPEECEALMPECRVNLSRIHLSPESTH